MELKSFPTILVIASVLTGGIIGLIHLTSVNGSITATTREPTGNVNNSKYLEITNHSYTAEPLFTIVNGTVLNTSNSTINSATIHIEYYDDNNSLITISSSTADFPILDTGDNSTFEVRSQLGEEVIDHYIAKPGGDIAP
jgi:hypothetical protein